MACFARPVAARDPSGAALCDQLCTAGGHRVAVIGGRGRWNVGSPAPIKRGAGGAGGGKPWVGTVRRHHGHGHHSPHSHERASRVARAGVGHPACGVRAGLHAGRCTPRGLHPAGCAGRGAGRGGVEHDRERGILDAGTHIARRCAGSGSDVPSGHFPRPDRRDRRRLRTGGTGLHQAHVGRRGDAPTRGRAAAGTRGPRGLSPGGAVFLWRGCAAGGRP